MLLQSWDRGIFWNQNQENERIEAIPPPTCASLAAAFYQMTFHVSTATLVLAAARHAQRNEPRFPVPQFLSAKGLSARHGRAVWLSKTFSANPGTLCALLSIFSLQFKGTSCSVGAFSRLGKGKQLMTMRDDCLPDDEDCSADPPSQTPASAASTSLPIARAERGRKGVTAVNRVLRAQTMRAS